MHYRLGAEFGLTANGPPMTLLGMQQGIGAAQEGLERVVYRARRNALIDVERLPKQEPVLLSLARQPAQWQLRQ